MGGNCLFLNLLPERFIATTPKYVMKVDDDTFVNLPRLYDLLTKDPRYKDQKHLLLGNCFCNNSEVKKVIYFIHLYQYS